MLDASTNSTYTTTKWKCMIWKESTTKWFQIQNGGHNPSCLYKKMLAGNLYCSPSPPHFVAEIWRWIPFPSKTPWKHVGNSKTDSWRFIHPLNPLSGPQEYHEKQTDDHGEENWDQFSTLDAKQKRQELDVECGRAYFLSHGIQTFCNQTTAPDTPQSPSRNRARNANMSPERIGRTHIPYTP